MEVNSKFVRSKFDNTDEKKIDNGDHILSELETDFKLGTDKYERLKFGFEMEKNCLLRQIQYYEEMQNKSQILYNQTITYINNLSSENVILKKQLDEMKNIDMENRFSQKENFSQRDIFTTEQFNQILIDKQNLLKQQESLLQEYQQQIARLSTDNKILLEKLDTERQTVISLQNERKIYLEERSLLKVIFEHMKNEITRLQKLEETISDVSDEANKLAIVAEYNKELGKKLKTEIEEKDKTILTLRNTIEHLNDIQLKNTKEKVSLCFELSELSQIKDKLDNQLSNVVKKNEELDEAKQDIVRCTSNQLEKFEKVQRKERIAFKELLKDMKLVTKQRNSLIKEREITIKELDSMKKLVDDYAKKIDYLLSIKEENEYTLITLLKRREEDDLKICKLQDKLRLETGTYVENVKQLEKLIFELRKEKTDMEDSINYLKNNTQKLYDDLNSSRSNEKELKDTLNSCLTEKKLLEEAIIKSGHVIANLTTDKDNLTQELQKSNEFCEKILSDLEKNLKNTTEKEELLKTELDEKKEMLLRSDIKNEQLIKEVIDKKEQLIRLQNDLEKIKSENIRFQEKIDHFSTIKLNVIELTEKLEQEKTSYAALSDIHKEISTKFIESVKKNVQEKEARLEIEKKLEQVKEQLKRIPTEKVVYLEDNVTYQDEIKVITAENEKLKKECQENQNLIFSLRRDIAQYQQQLIGLEFQKSEVTLRLHELQKKYEIQVNLCDQLQNIQKVILETIYKLKENELIDQEQCSSLINVMKI
ncbi:centromere-associated protein E-like [Diorhabda carinulata]|uniref:centromere-associated protein E-like n=1 Tax=Diorhabda carinulata TaxID=1163345 RepID=UPI0025A2747A|nr:centromere-associated protein E-like [Diorhabda carinulata]